MIDHRIPKRVPRLIAAAGLCLVLLPAGAMADSQQRQSFGYWKGQDNCAKAAQKKYPDYTKEGNAKREQEFRACLLNAGRLGHPALDPIPSGANASADRTPPQQ
jgi:hypothetical protein